MINPKVAIEKVFETIYLPSLLLCCAIQLLERHLKLNSLLLDILVYISGSLFIFTLILAGIFNWQWAYRHPAHSKSGQILNRILSLICASSNL